MYNQQFDDVYIQDIRAALEAMAAELEGFKKLVNYLIYKGKEPERKEPNEGNE